MAGRRGFAAATSGGKGGRRGGCLSVKSMLTNKLPGGPPYLVNRRFGNFGGAFQKIEVAAFVGLLDVGQEHLAVAARELELGRLPGRAPLRQLLLRNEHVELPGLHVD